ncbi:alpha-protein kinase 1, partial [Exaiptasia diaphana]|uniref:Alpha-type protein kinase domain-containing protein n=1 Tax=Exaiptasia diaphana TaxID=2652724 RepID=A0A913XW59_EXADI
FLGNKRTPQSCPSQVDIVTLQLQEFSITEMWQEPFKAKFLLQRESFSKGGLREAFIAKALSGMATRGKYVLKKCQKDKEENVLQYSPTLEEHMRKIVQMSALARNFAQSLELQRPKDYGATFAYEKVYFSSMNGEFITLEKFIEGKFKKLINNTGEVLGDDILKAEAFVHYTYVYEQLMVTDIQGVGYTLCDPEIASTAEDEDKSKLFCCGNLSELAIRGFLNGHSCNKFCNLLKLSDDNRN